MIELLRAAAAELPGHTAAVTDARSVTYAEVLRAAEAAAAELRDRRIDRFAILEPDAVAVWALLAAASLAGVEACVYPAEAPDEVLHSLRERLGHATLVTSRPEFGTGIISPAELLESDAAWAADELAPTRPLLILTSGTSGHPKAARHEWARLLRVTRRIVPTPEHRWLLAYALNQFAGLQVLLHVAAARATLVVPESVQPRDGLAAMRRWDVTHASGTPTFWRFLLAEIRRDEEPVPPLRQVTLGGEAVPSALIGQVRETFPDARISQIYIGTEMGQGVTVRDGFAGLPLGVLEQHGDVELRIVDGELWVRSASAMLGYFGQDPLGGDGWRPTGDLVEVAGDRIMFRGRKTDVINVGGVKVHPVPIEEHVSKIDGVALVHAYGRPNALVGHIVALDVVPAPGADEDALEAAIREACADLAPAARPRSIRFVPDLRIGGNKLARASRP